MHSHWVFAARNVGSDRAPRTAPVAILGGIVLLLTSCGGDGAITAPSVTPTVLPCPSPTPSQGTSPTASPSQTATPTASPTVEPTSAPTPSPPPSLIGREWSRIPTTQQVVALTFDCGANAAGVPSILKTLRIEGISATFFLTGDWTRSFPERAREIAGTHPVGNHSNSHRRLPGLSDVEVRAQIREAEGVIREITGRDPRPLFRFPYGASDVRTIRIINQLGYGGIRWTIDTLGWKGKSGDQTADSVVRRVMDRLEPGAIVLMHVGSAPDRSTLDADALPDLIERIRARGYRFVTVGEFL